ncbi:MULTISPECIES: RNA-binding protein [unclassified Caballeronia]|uniref:RNA-binding protein n=1 Tax=unclassified Caballeronia TaxID=2646786 RepID=UPI002029A3C1|nr:MULTISPECIES: RNA-binding protein [unclassified Caballeronia]
MTFVLVNNIEAESSDDEIKQFLAKYGFPPCDGIERVPGDGSAPAAVLIFERADPELLRRLQPRVHDLFWKNRRIVVQVVKDRPE